jgi:hypothetical protein
MNFDELRLWGAYPKVMYYSDALPQFSRQMFSYNYPPGIMLIQYFFLSLKSTFRDYTLYLVYYSFYLALICPAFARVKKSFFSIFFGSLFVLVFLNLFIPFWGDDEVIVFMTLYIDPLIGVLFGYCLILIAHQKEIGSTWFYQFLLANSLIVLLKESGIVFAGAICIFYLVDSFLLSKKEPHYLKPKIINAVIACIIPAIMYISWNSFINYHFKDFAEYTSTYLSFSYNLFHLPAYTNLVTKELLSALVSKPIFGTYFSFLQYFGILFFISILFYSSTRKLRPLILQFGVFLCCCVYIGFLWYCYLFVFQKNEAISLASLDRYLHSAIIGVGLYYLFDCIKFFLAHPVKSNFKTYSIASLISIVLSISVIKSNFQVLSDFIDAPGKTINITYDFNYSTQVVFAEEDIQIITSKIPAGESYRLFYSPGACDLTMALSHHITYYKLLDYQIIVKNYFSTLDCLTMENIEQQLTNVDYLFLSYPVSKEFNEEFNNYFQTSINLEENIVYSIEFSDNQLKISGIK